MRLASLLLLALAFACSSPSGSAQPSQPEASSEPKDSAQAAPKEAPASVVIEAPGGEVSFRVELARTDAERQRGLMFREHLDEDAGMLFLFERMRRQSFWMKNTKIPLDMLFIDDTGEIVGVVENAEPFTLDPRGVSQPSQYVLELNAGTSRRLGIRAGMKTRFVGVPGHPVKATGPVR